MEQWQWTYNLIVCLVAFPLLGFFGGKWIKIIDAKINQVCASIKALHEKLDDAIEKLDGRKRNKDMCDEKMRAVYVEQEHIKGEIKDIKEILSERI